jgi:tripartite-type tricarboxylate transporter receptor subunit TctC
MREGSACPPADKKSGAAVLLYKIAYSFHGRLASISDITSGVKFATLSPERIRGPAMKLPRRTFLHLAVGAATLPVVSRTATAQTYPARPITLIVPFPPGGSTDVGARIVADHMSRTLGQQVVVQNVSGAGGTTGSTRAMRSDPDGYTILMGQMGTHAAAVALYPNLAYRPDVDFEPIGMVTAFPLIVAARKDFPAEDFKEFIAYVKANDTKLNQAHAGVGSIFFTSCLLLNSILGAKPTLVPFNGGAPAMNALVAGQVDYMCADIVTGGPQLEPGKIKVYAIASAARNPAMPNVPTTVEAGLPAFQASAWNGLFAPKSTPQPILDRLVDALDKALDDEATRKRLGVLGGDIPERPSRGPQPFLALVKSEIERWSPIIKAANVKME